MVFFYLWSNAIWFKFMRQYGRIVWITSGKWQFWGSLLISQNVFEWVFMSRLTTVKARANIPPLWVCHNWRSPLEQECAISRILFQRAFYCNGSVGLFLTKCLYGAFSWHYAQLSTQLAYIFCKFLWRKLRKRRSTWVSLINLMEIATTEYGWQCTISSSTLIELDKSVRRRWRCCCEKAQIELSVPWPQFSGSDRQLHTKNIYRG